MSIYGPTRKTSTQNVEAPTVDHSVYVRKTGTRMTGRINMGGMKITSLAEPTEDQDAATARYVSQYVSHLNNVKVSKDGDTMTGSLDMSGEKITRVGDPTDNKDAVTKEYVDALIQHVISLHGLGRYIILLNKKDGTKTYFSVRAKKNVDLDNGKLVEISSLGRQNERLLQIGIVSESVELDNPGKRLNIMQYNTSNLEVYFNPPNTIPAPWNISFSAVIPNTTSTFLFQVNPVTRSRIEMLWNVDGLTFVIYNIHGQIEYTGSVSGLSQQDFNHVSINYVDDKLYFWVNGVQKIAYRSLNLKLLSIELSVPKLGILTFYNRDLHKNEIIQHFIDYHVKNFTNDKVLI